MYGDFNRRKGGGSARRIEISKREHFYQQEYCGCAYSLRDTNAWRREKGREPIKIGVKYYGDDDDEKVQAAFSPPQSIYNPYIN